MGTNRPASTGDDGARRPFFHGRLARLPDHRAGWRWEPYAVDGADVEAARQQLQRLMRDAEADVAEALSGHRGPRRAPHALPPGRPACPCSMLPNRSAKNVALLLPEPRRPPAADLPRPEAGSGAPEGC